jgi:hypothetical protein
VIATAINRPAVRLSARRERVSFVRLLWVAPLTVGLALALNFAIKLGVQALDPSLSHLGQLQTPLVTLTVEGAVAAIAVFALVACLSPRPIFWYRILAGVALVVSLIPDMALAIGGAPMMAAMSVVGPLLRMGSFAQAGGASAGGAPAGGPPSAGGMPGSSIEEVLVLMLLHVATAVVCIVLLTTLARLPARRVDS